MTAADRVAAALVLLAGVFLGALLARHGLGGLSGLPPLAGLVLAAAQALRWTQSRRRPGCTLQRQPDSTLVVLVEGQGARPAVLGPRTRVLGPSVFIEVRFVMGGELRTCRRWLTPMDVPAPALRRWSVVLPSTGRVACS